MAFGSKITWVLGIVALLAILTTAQSYDTSARIGNCDDTPNCSDGKCKDTCASQGYEAKASSCVKQFGRTFCCCSKDGSE
uniref:Defensin-like protein n=1 Tax=Aegilops tauschii TaxID=37682 RepID=R7VYX2_AEGTA